MKHFFAYVLDGFFGGIYLFFAMKYVTSSLATNAILLTLIILMLPLVLLIVYFNRISQQKTSRRQKVVGIVLDALAFFVTLLTHLVCSLFIQFRIFPPREMYAVEGFWLIPFLIILFFSVQIPKIILLFTR